MFAIPLSTTRPDIPPPTLNGAACHRKICFDDCGPQCCRSTPSAARVLGAIEALPNLAPEVFFQASGPVSGQLRSALAGTAGVLTTGMDTEQIWEQLRLKVGREARGLFAHGPALVPLRGA